MFSNRELALYTWAAIILIWMLSKSEVRKNIPGLIRATFAFKLTAVYITILIYTVLTSLLLFRFQLWNFGQLKNTAIWFFSVGLVSLFDIAKDKEGNRLAKTYKDIFGLTAIIQFIVGVYSFSYFAELFIIPLITLLSMMVIVAGDKKEHASVKKFANNVLAIFGITLIGYSIYKIVIGFNDFVTRQNLDDFLVPGLLSFLYLPLVYILSMFIVRENVFLTVKRVLKEKKLICYARWKTLLKFNFNTTDLKRWQSIVLLQKVRTKDEIRKSIRLIKEQKKYEKNPPKVDAVEGWSPYAAKDFLADLGVKTDFYKPVYEEEWAASSLYIKIDDDFLGNNISFYLEGDKEKAINLKLVLNVYQPKNSKDAHSKFLAHCELLFSKAMNRNMGDQMQKNIFSGKSFEEQIGNRNIKNAKQVWEKHKENGYACSFQIKIIAE